MPGTGLRLDGVGRRYGLRGPWVLRDLTLAAPPGSLVRIEGVNGSGKSTLLRIVAGVDRPTAGRVSGRPDASTAYVPERFPPALPFPALRYLTHLGAVRGLPPAIAREQAAYWLDRFGVTGYARTPLDELSKGTCQKVAVAQALLADPELLVLDEAWTGLDTTARATLDTAVRDLVAVGGTVFFVDHDPRRLADEPTLTHTIIPPGSPSTRPTPPAAYGGPGSGPSVDPGRPVLSATSGGAEPVPSVPDAVSGGGPGPGPRLDAGRPVPGAALRGADRAPVVPSDAYGGDPVDAGRVVVEAVGGVGVPEGVRGFVRESAGADGVRLVVPAGRSDGVLRALLGAEPPWHIIGVRAQAASAAASRRPAAVVVPGPRRTAALLRYQADLLLRSQRWLPPVLGYAAIMAIGVAGGEPLLGSLGYAAALLLPVAAWLVRVCVANEPAAARACTASAVGAGRAQAGALATALLASALLGVLGTAAVAAISGAHSDDMRTAVPVGAAAVAGLLAAAVSVLLGTAVGALTNPPLVRGSGWSVLVTALGAGAVLLVSGSPAQAAVTGLVTGSRTGAVHYPILPVILAALATSAACWFSCRAVARLGGPTG